MLLKKQYSITIIILNYIYFLQQPANAHSPGLRSWFPLLIPFDIGMVIFVDAMLILFDGLLLKKKANYKIVFLFTIIGNFFAVILWYFRILDIVFVIEDVWVYLYIPLLTLIFAISGLIYSYRKSNIKNQNI